MLSQRTTPVPLTAPAGARCPSVAEKPPESSLATLRIVRAARWLAAAQALHPAWHVLGTHPAVGRWKPTSNPVATWFQEGGDHGVGT